jgi:hypothetical protein
MVRLEELRKLKKNKDLIGALTHHLSACSIVPQTTTIPRAPVIVLRRRNEAK